MCSEQHPSRSVENDWGETRGEAGRTVRDGEHNPSRRCGGLDQDDSGSDEK